MDYGIYEMKPQTVVYRVFMGIEFTTINVGCHQVDSPNEESDENWWSCHSLTIRDACDFSRMLSKLDEAGMIGLITDEEFKAIVSHYGVGAEGARQLKELQSEEYYNSTAVSSFTYKGFAMWTDFTNRQKLRMRLEAEKEGGMTDTTIWYAGHRFVLPIATTQQLLTAVELYASKCFDVKNQHAVALKELEAVDEVAAYDHTAGYPTKLEFK